jgi:quercetin 2,3-dioxygenase
MPQPLAISLYPSSATIAPCRSCRTSRSPASTDAAGTCEYKLASANHGVYAFVVEGSVTCNGTALGKRDSTGIWSTDKVTIQTGAEKSDILIVETIM